MEDKLKNLDKENIIWLIYIFIFVMAIVSNYYEEKYLFTKDYKSKKVYTNINKISKITIIITIGLLIKLSIFSKVRYSYPVIFIIILKRFKNKGANIRKLVTLNPA